MYTIRSTWPSSDKIDCTKIYSIHHKEGEKQVKIVDNLLINLKSGIFGIKHNSFRMRKAYKNTLI